MGPSSSKFGNNGEEMSSEEKFKDSFAEFRLSSPDEEVSLSEVMKRSRNHCIPFPIRTATLQHLLQDESVANWKQQLHAATGKHMTEALANHYVNSTYPVIHEAVLPLLEQFLCCKRRSKYSIERNYYKDKTVFDLVNRLLQKRPVVFLSKFDAYVLPDGEDGHGTQFENIGRRESRNTKFKLKDFMSYDEMRLAALVSVSSWSPFINNGERYNQGRLEERDAHELEGVIVGQVGPRFEKQGLMDWQDIIVDVKQNTLGNGYGDCSGAEVWDGFRRSATEKTDDFKSDARYSTAKGDDSMYSTKRDDNLKSDTRDSTKKDDNLKSDTRDSTKKDDHLKSDTRNYTKGDDNIKSDTRDSTKKDDNLKSDTRNYTKRDDNLKSDTRHYTKKDDNFNGNSGIRNNCNKDNEICKKDECDNNGGDDKIESSRRVSNNDDNNRSKSALLTQWHKMFSRKESTDPRVVLLQAWANLWGVRYLPTIDEVRELHQTETAETNTGATEAAGTTASPKAESIGEGAATPLIEPTNTSISEATRSPITTSVTESTSQIIAAPSAEKTTTIGAAAKTAGSPEVTGYLKQTLSGQREIYFSVQVYKARIQLLAEVLLIEASTRAKAVQKKAYVHVVGLGLGVWQVHRMQPQMFVDAWADAIEALVPHSVMDHVAYINFSWIPVAGNSIRGTASGDVYPNTSTVVVISKRALHDPVPTGCLLVSSFAWDSNSSPGNEYWENSLTTSSDPAAACSSGVAELHNHRVNSRVSAQYLRVASVKHGVLPLAHYLDQL